jgi:DNA-binding response OmpR family regulator
MRFAVLTQRKEHLSAIEDCFHSDGVVCQWFGDTPSLLRASRSQNYDLTLIDAQSFRTDGHELLSWRTCHADHRMQIIVFGQFPDRDSLFRAFDAGVSDVLVGSIDKNEMYVRTHRVLKSTKKPAGREQSVLSVGDYMLYQEQSLVTYKDKPIYLTAREFAVAWLFFSTPGTFFSKQQLASSIWGCSPEFTERTIEQHIYKLRKKLFITKSSSIRLRTIYSLGYKLEMASPAGDAEESSAAIPGYLQQELQRIVCQQAARRIVDIPSSSRMIALGKYHVK